MRPFSIPKSIAMHQKPNEWLLTRANEIKSKLQALKKGNQIDVSVVVPAFNEEANILKTISSIAETKSNFSVELIVVDNNSTDLTKDYITQTGAEYLFEPKAGVKNARTAGLMQAKGRYIISADADTIYSPYWVEKMIKPIHKNQNIALCYGKFAFLPDQNYNRFNFFIYELFGDIYKKINGILRDKSMYVYGCSSAFRKEQALVVDAYEHPIESNEDGHLALKLRERFGYLKRITHTKVYAWTSSRQLITHETLFNRFINKVKHAF